MRQGAKDVLVKPVSEKDLVDNVNKHLAVQA
jgi:FixJ family two-component response regulator